MTIDNSRNGNHGDLAISVGSRQFNAVTLALLGTANFRWKARYEKFPALT